MGRLQFRDALPSDLEDLIATTQIAHNEHAARVPEVFWPDAEAETARMIRHHFVSKAGGTSAWTRIVVCTIDDVFAGHVLFGFWRAPFGAEAHDVCAEIADISVVPAQRGNGIGKQLFQRAQIEMKASGATIAQATVWRGNATSATLFTDGGYVVRSQVLEFRLREPNDYPMPKPEEASKTPDPPRGLTQEAYSWLMVLALIGYIIWTSR